MFVEIVCQNSTTSRSCHLSGQPSKRSSVGALSRLAECRTYSLKTSPYDGVFFWKAGTVVHAYQLSIHREPSLYPDPERFNPNRWLRPEYPTYKAPLSRFLSLQKFSSLGFVRRICLGMNIAERSLFLLTARIMWACEFSKNKDSTGNDIEVSSYDYTSGFNTQPRLYQFDLKARNEKRQQLVDKAWRHAETTDPLRVPGSLI